MRSKTPPDPLIRTAVCLWLAFAVVTWHIIFDHKVQVAAKLYLQRQSLHQQGLAPPVTIDEVMRPAVRRAARLATLGSAALAIVGLAAVAYAARRQPDTRRAADLRAPDAEPRAPEP